MAAYGSPLPEDGDYVQLPTSCDLCSEPLAPSELNVTYLTWYEGDGKHSAVFSVCEQDAMERHAATGALGERLVDRDPQNGRRTR